jgi:cell division protein ZapA
MMNEKLSIRVNIADRYYPLKIERKDEEKIRKAAKLINEKVLQYKQKYTDKDIQDFLAMAALQFVIRFLDSDDEEVMNPVIEEIRALSSSIDKILNEE